MNDTDIAASAALFGDPARARMLMALMGQLLGRRWVLRLEQTRALHLTPSGLEGLKNTFGVRL